MEPNKVKWLSPRTKCKHTQKTQRSSRFHKEICDGGLIFVPRKATHQAALQVQKPLPESQTVLLRVVVSGGVVANSQQSERRLGKHGLDAATSGSGSALRDYQC